MGTGEARTEVSVIIANETVAIGYGRGYVGFTYTNSCCQCDVCKDMVSTIYSLEWGTHLCLSCLRVWQNDPEWLDLIALVTEAENDPSTIS